jgi:phosphocarrier protein FPr/phosphocarrier protein
MANLIIAAPLKGWAAPLDEMPDAVFAERMMGDGLAIDPVASVLCAPFDGEIASLPRTGHAVALRADNGAEVLMHVGLETVALGGDGFMAHVREGQRVKAGERLLSFDLDFLAQRAKSLITPIVVTNGELFDIVERSPQRAIDVGQPLMQLRLRGAAPSSLASGARASRTATLGFEHGLHARPAAQVAKTAQAFGSEITLSAGGRRANAKSPVSLMTLGANEGDVISIEAQGGDAEAAADAVMRSLASNTGPVKASASPSKRAQALSGQGLSAQGSAQGSAQERAQGKAKRSSDEIIGVCAAPGLGVGRAVLLKPPEFEVAEAGRGREAEEAALRAAKAQVRTQLEKGVAGGEKQRGILAAHIALLEDPELSAEAARLIQSGKSAGFAWRTSIARQIGAFAALNDPYMRERAADLRDIAQQVLMALGGKPAPAQTLPEDAIVIADEILPSEFAALDPQKLKGIAMAGGGPTSHVALLAAAAGTPAIAAAGPGLLEIAEGTEVLLDASAGLVRISPSPAIKQEALEAAKARLDAERQAKAHAMEECRTKDGVRIVVLANLASLNDAKTALAQGAEGCGLLRTEFLFMDRDAPPSIAEQAAAYQAIAEALADKPLTIRTLDAAPDKPVAYVNAPHEDNPALGLRGLRAGLRQPDLLGDQLKAILEVKPREQVRVLLPMVTDLSEARAVRAMLGAANIALGAMIETPAAALLADQLARELDFLSLGTNDLSQYALAMDRGHPDFAGAVDALHPAVLRLVKIAADGAAKHGKPISVCGASASDLAAAPILIGLGVNTLSVAPAMAAMIKARLRSLSLSDCRALAERALLLEDANEVRALAAKFGIAP